MNVFQTCIYNHDIHVYSIQQYSFEIYKWTILLLLILIMMIIIISNKHEIQIFIRVKKFLMIDSENIRF